MFNNTKIWIPSRHPESRIQIRNIYDNYGEFIYNNNRYRVNNFREINPNIPIVDKQKLTQNESWKELTQQSCIQLQYLEMITQGCFSTEENLTRVLTENISLETPPRRQLPQLIQNIARTPQRDVLTRPRISSHRVEQLGNVLQDERNIRRRIDFENTPRAPRLQNSRLVRNLSTEFEHEEQDLTDIPRMSRNLLSQFEEQKKRDEEQRKRFLELNEEDEEEEYKELTKQNILNCENVRSDALIEPLYKTLHKNICIFISLTETDIKSYCYPVDYLQSLFGNPEIFEWISIEYNGINTGRAMTYLPVVKLPEQGVFIDILSTRMALMFNTFVVEDLKEKNIGSFFAVSSLHGEKELIRTLRPISRNKYLEIKNKDNKLEEIKKLLNIIYISTIDDVYNENSIGWEYNINREPLSYPPYYTRKNEMLEKNIELSLSKNEYQIIYEFGFNRFIIKVNNILFKELTIEQLIPKIKDGNINFETNIIAENGNKDEGLINVSSTEQDISIQTLMDHGFDVLNYKNNNNYIISIKGKDIQFNIEIWNKIITFVSEQEEETEEGEIITRRIEEHKHMFIYDNIEIYYMNDLLKFNFRGNDGIVLKK